MTAASHVGRFSLRTGPTNRHVCRRCGIDWVDTSWEYCPGAPCLDCRELLCTYLGVKMAYWRRPRAGVLAPCELSPDLVRQ